MMQSVLRSGRQSANLLKVHGLDTGKIGLFACLLLLRFDFRPSRCSSSICISKAGSGSRHISTCFLFNVYPFGKFIVRQTWS